MKSWTITFGDKTWTDDDATVVQVVAVAELTDNSWSAMSPWSSPRHLAAWLAVLLAGAIGDLETATALVYAMSPTELAECLAEREDIIAPTAPVDTSK
jgi:hypothetical protein